MIPNGSVPLLRGFFLTTVLGTVLACGAPDAEADGFPLDSDTFVQVLRDAPEGDLARWEPPLGMWPVQDEAASFFDAPYLHRIDVEIPEASWHSLRENALELDATTTFTPVELFIDGAPIGQVGIRPKGGQGTLKSCVGVGGEPPTKKCPKLSYKLKFSEVEAGKRFVGLKRLNLQSSIMDASLLEEYFGFELYRRMGVPTPRVTFGELHVNGSLIGTFPLVEDVDRQFLKTRFRDASGNLYKNFWPVSMDEKRWDALLETNDDVPDHSHLSTLKQAFEGATEDQLTEVLEQHVHADLFAAFVEVDRAIVHWDGPLRFRYFPNGREYRGNNFFLYDSPEFERVVFIPWDLDNTLSLESPLPPMAPWNDLTVDCESERDVTDSERAPPVTYRHPSCDPMVRALAKRGTEFEHSRLVNDVFRVGEMRVELSEKAALLFDAIERDPDRDLLAWQRAVERLGHEFSALHAAAAEHP